MVHAEESILIRAPQNRVFALYADYGGWPRLFPETIRGVRFLAENRNTTTLEIEHVEGKVVNLVRFLPPDEIQLEEFKRHYDARFTNRFERRGAATRYTLVADVAPKGWTKALLPIAQTIVRSKMRRFVLEPMKRLAESREGEEGAALSP